MGEAQIARLGDSGKDTLVGGPGDDTMSGFGGDDEYYVDSASDKVIEIAGYGYDTVNSTVTYTLSDNVSQQ